MGVALDTVKAVLFSKLVQSCLRCCRALAIILLGLSLPLRSVGADNGDEQGAVLGIGSESCSVFMTTYEHNPDSVDEDHHIGDEGAHFEASYTSADYINWIQGYLSAYNTYEYNNGNIASRASIGGMLNILYRRCSETPNAAFYTKLPALLERINPEQNQ